MVIEENIEITTFEELDNGDVFRYGSVYFLKIPPCEAAGTGYHYNSYDLVNNDYCFFPDCREIILPAKAKLVIE